MSAGYHRLSMAEREDAWTAWLKSVAVTMTTPSLPGVTFKRIRLP